MRKVFAIVMGLAAISSSVAAQEKFFTKTGKVSFYSKAPLENIEAHNRSVTCVLDSKSGNVQFSVLMKGFEFEKALMQRHFNENYLETTRYPKADFKGQIMNNGELDYSKEGIYKTRVKGMLTIHGQTKEVETDGTLTVKNGRLTAESDFTVKLADYKIKNDKMNNISNTIRVSVNCSLEPLKP